MNREGRSEVEKHHPAVFRTQRTPMVAVADTRLTPHVAGGTYRQSPESRDLGAQLLEPIMKSFVVPGKGIDPGIAVVE